jgi:hypothetical protein
LASPGLTETSPNFPFPRRFCLAWVDIAFETLGAAGLEPNETISLRSGKFGDVSRIVHVTRPAFPRVSRRRSTESGFRRRQERSSISTATLSDAQLDRDLFLLPALSAQLLGLGDQNSVALGLGEGGGRAVEK